MYKLLNDINMSGIIIYKEYISCWVSTSNLEERRFDKNEKKNFYYKNPSLHCYHFISPYQFGNSNKEMTFIHYE